jgi:hypothetical protein
MMFLMMIMMYRLFSLFVCSFVRLYIVASQAFVG